MRIHTAAEIREIDHWAESVLGISLAVLMENAGRAVAEAVFRGIRGGDPRFLSSDQLDLYPKRESSRYEFQSALTPSTPTIHLVCGKGNNGGDGFVAARHLHSAGFRVRVISLAEPEELSGAAQENAKAALACGVSFVDSLDAKADDIIVDALFGTGLNRPVAGPALSWVEAVNSARQEGAFVVSVDLPSGLDADLPIPPGHHVIADLSVALHSLKPAHLQFPARSFCGEVEVASIGIPSLERFEKVPGKDALETSKPVISLPKRRLLTRDSVVQLLPKRAADTHKGKSGHLVIVAGSPGKSGAAVLAAKAALRAGAGLVTVASGAEVVDRVLSAIPEVMGHVLADWSAQAMLGVLNIADAWVAGPGMFRDEKTGEELIEAMKRANLPACLDADALNALAEDPKALASLSSLLIPPPLLTPHPKELARLLGRETGEIQADRFLAGTQAAAAFDSTVVLKGAMSVIASSQGELCVNPTGGPSLASAGTGDVLAGVCGALLSQGLDSFEAGQLGAWVHGRAGDLAARGRDRGLIAGDVIEALPEALGELREGRELHRPERTRR